MANEKRLIDANALKERLNDLEAQGGYKYYRQGMNDTLHDLVPTIIDDLPTVDAVEVVHARWETQTDGTHFCTHCGCDAPYKWDDIDRSFINSADDVPDRPSNYCPNCGADMRGE